MAADEALLARLARLFDENETGVSDELLQSEFGNEYGKLADVLNTMLEQRRVTILQAQDDTLVYKLVSKEKASKLQGLSREQELIYQEIKKAGNQGIWTRKIKLETNVQQQVLTKTLKLLEQRQLIKSVKSVTSRSKKLYMLFEEVPATEITGGAWYSEGEFDHEFVNGMSQFVYTYITQAKSATLQDIAKAVRESGLSKVDLSTDDVRQIVESLIFDGRVERVQSSMLTQRAIDAGPLYRSSPKITPPQFVTENPCGVCPVASQCCEGGVISPSTCVYMNCWLELDSVDF